MKKGPRKTIAWKKNPRKKVPGKKSVFIELKTLSFIAKCRHSQNSAKKTLQPCNSNMLYKWCRVDRG